MARNEVDVRTAVLQVLLTKIADDRNPSVALMNLTESMLAPDEMGAYVEILLDKIRSDKSPSIARRDRVRGLAG